MKLVALVMLVACSQPAATPNNPDPPVARAAMLLVANKAESTLSIHELPDGKELARLPTGNGPHEVAVSTDGLRAVVTNYGGQADLGKTLTVVDLTARAVEKTVELGEFRRPHGIAFLDEDRVIVTAEVNAAVVIVDVAKGTIEKSISTSQQGSHMLALSPDKQRVYVANIGSGSITPIDLATGTAREAVPAIATSEAIGVTPDGAQVWTASLKENTIVAFSASRDGALARLGEVAGAGTPIRAYPTPDGKSMLVTNVNGSKLQIVDVATRVAQVVEFPPANGETAAPLGATISDDSKTAYVALIAENRVAIVDLATRAVTGHITVGQGPDGIAFVPSLLP
jgi:YVTN family beta-propeller protein